MKTCTVDGCEKPIKNRGAMCRMHTARRYRHGSTDARRGNSGSLLERYERFVVRGDGCWAWSGYTNARGYGAFAKRYAHRVAYELFVGPIPDGLYVLHRCDNPPCTNPEHLFLGTHADNMADMARKGRARGGLPDRRAPLGKLRPADVDRMRELRMAGATSKDIAAQFTVSANYVTQLISGRKAVRP